MSSFKHLLVPTDFGDVAERALDVALDLARLSGARVSILYVSILPPSAHAPYAQGPYVAEDELARHAQVHLDRLVDRARQRYPRVGGILSSGDPRERILEVARDLEADLIVMGTHSRRGLPRILMGSIAESVVRQSPVPVLTLSAQPEVPPATTTRSESRRAP